MDFLKAWVDLKQEALLKIIYRNVLFFSRNGSKGDLFLHMKRVTVAFDPSIKIYFEGRVMSSPIPRNDPPASRSQKINEIHLSSPSLQCFLPLPAQNPSSAGPPDSGSRAPP